MTLYLGTWKIMDSNRVGCMTYFASMTPEDDKNESPGVELLGRWSVIGDASGAFICRAVNHTDVTSWLYNWVPMATIKIKPICDDNTARKIILKKINKINVISINLNSDLTPNLDCQLDYQVDYSHVNDEPEEDETLYMINYKFHKDKKVDGAKAFADLTEEQDKMNIGNCRPLGRWHDLGQGSGMAIAAAKSESDIYSWVFNWTGIGICDFEIVPVLTDKQGRKVISSKPDFNTKLETVKKLMKIS